MSNEAINLLSDEFPRDVLRLIIFLLPPSSREALRRVAKRFKTEIELLEHEGKITRPMIRVFAGENNILILTPHRGNPLLFFGGRRKQLRNLSTIQDRFRSLTGITVYDDTTLIYGQSDLNKLLLIVDKNDSSVPAEIELPDEISSLDNIAVGPGYIIVSARHQSGALRLYDFKRIVRAHGYHDDPPDLTPINIPDEIDSMIKVEVGGSFFLVYGCDKHKKPVLFACGRLGDKIDCNDLRKIALPNEITELKNVSAGDKHVIVYGLDDLKNPRVYAFGENVYGQLGLINDQGRNHLEEVNLPEKMYKLINVFTGKDHTFFLGLSESGEPLLYGCGNNSYGQLGANSRINNAYSLRHIPIPDNIMQVVDVATNGKKTLLHCLDTKENPVIYSTVKSRGFVEMERPVIYSKEYQELIREKEQICNELEDHIRRLKNEFQWFGLKKSPEAKIKCLVQFQAELKQNDAEMKSRSDLLNKLQRFSKDEVLNDHRNRFAVFGFWKNTPHTRTRQLIDENIERLVVLDKP